MFRQFSKLLFYPEDGSSTGTATPEMGKEDIIKFLGEDDEEKEIIPLEDKKVDKEVDKEEEEVAEEASEESDELAELEEELQEPTDEQLELVTPNSRREILTKYPKLFKDFPYLEKAMYREQQFTELLPTINDAKQALEARDTLGKVERDLIDGNTENLLKAAKNGSEKSFNKIVDNYLDTLRKVDDKAWAHVVGNTIKYTIMSMVQEGKRSGNEVLQNAAQILNQFIFASSDFVPPQNLTKEEKVNTGEDELTKQKNEFAIQRFNAANNDLSARVNHTFKSTIEANIDPKESMTSYVRQNASRDALEALGSAISSDTRFKILVDKLWEKAAQENFSSDSINRIKSAFLSKAKTLLPSIIKTTRNEALKGMGKRVVEEAATSIKRGSTRETPHSNDRSDSKVPAGMSTLEYMMKD